MFFFFFFNDTATPEIYPLSLHDALPILRARERGVPAERDFHRRREPAEPIAAVFLMEERRFGEVHLTRHVLRSEEHTSELQSQSNLVCRLLLEKKKQTDPRQPHRADPVR